MWHSAERELNEDYGSFECPRCEREFEYRLIRTWSYFHLFFFIPVCKEHLISEHVRCSNCGEHFPVAVLAAGAQMVEAGAALQPVDRSVQGSIGNVVELSEAAVEEIRRRHGAGEFEPDVVVRVEPHQTSRHQLKVAFDFALADGRDWIGQSDGIPVVVDRRIAGTIHGVVVDFRDGEFVRR